MTYLNFKLEMGLATKPKDNQERSKIIQCIRKIGSIKAEKQKNRIDLSKLPNFFQK